MQGLICWANLYGQNEADKSYNLEYYVSKFTLDAGWEIGINEISSSTVRKLKFEQFDTATKRLRALAKHFGCRNCIQR